VTVTNVQGRVLGGGRIVTVTNVQGRVRGPDSDSD
jgi:hypothetical protein